MSTAPVHLVVGEDPVLRSDAVKALIRQLLGDDDPSLALEEFTLAAKAGGDPATADPVDAAAIISAEAMARRSKNG